MTYVMDPNPMNYPKWALPVIEYFNLNKDRRLDVTVSTPCVLEPFNGSNPTEQEVPTGEVIVTIRGFRK